MNEKEIWVVEWTARGAYGFDEVHKLAFTNEESARCWSNSLCLKKSVFNVRPAESIALIED